jgi:hypothetical protein
VSRRPANLGCTNSYAGDPGGFRLINRRMRNYGQFSS